MGFSTGFNITDQTDYTKKYSPIEINEENELIIWGIVTYVIKKL